MTKGEQNGETKAATRRLLFVAPEDWFFFSHFLALARAARTAGFETALATRIDRHRQALEREGLTLFQLEGVRGSLASGSALAEARAIKSAVAAFKPDIVHLFTVRTMLLGGLALLAHRSVRLVFAPTGLGYLYANKRFITGLIRFVLGFVLRLWLKRGRAGMIAENPDDPVELGVGSSDPMLAIVGGAGLDSEHFPAMAMPPSPPMRFAIVARMLKSKGIAEAVAAFQHARAVRPNVELHLYGDCDPANPTSFRPVEMEAFARAPGVFWHGHVSDVQRVWRANHIALLLSYREGMPRSLAEAAASARPIIATNVPGCREIVDHGKSGLLVPLGNVKATLEAMLRLADDAELRASMGEAGRVRFQSRFTSDIVTGAILAHYALVSGASRP
ncbi:RfaG Glycosyltransferase [Rhabdaerophilaceae bacterium]